MHAVILCVILRMPRASRVCSVRQAQLSVKGYDSCHNVLISPCLAVFFSSPILSFVNAIRAEASYLKLHRTLTCKDPR